jgi:methyl-accepting chemotaxis protein
LLQPLGQIIEITKGIAAGKLNQKIISDRNDKIGELMMAMKLMQARLQTVIGKLTEVSNDVTQDAVMLSSSSKRTLEMMSKQQIQTELVATAMNEMSATVSEVARNTEEAAQAATEAEGNSENGKEIVINVRETINRLVREVENTADAITDLEEKSDDIQSIMGVIHSIADQTNLLALNAAIEAARAGEQGRGFAVVADEVRMLAGRTQDATKQINSVIEELRAGITSAVHMMNKERKQAYDAIEESNLADTALAAISTSVARINDMNSQIAAAATEQSAVAEEMNRNVVSINQMTEGTVETARYNSEAGVRLAKLSQEMQQQFATFELGNAANQSGTTATESTDEDGLF